MSCRLSERDFDRTYRDHETRISHRGLEGALTGEILKTVFILDADKEVRRRCANRFLDAGYRVVHGESSHEVLPFLAHQKPEAFVIGELFRAAGWELPLLSEIRGADLEVQVFFFVEHWGVDRVERVLNAGANAVYDRKRDFDALARTVVDQVAHRERPEGRKDARIPFLHPIWIRKYYTTELVEARVGNISRGGLFIEGVSPLPSIGEGLQFVMPRMFKFSTDIRGRGVVRWVRAKALDALSGPGYGLEIIEMSGPNLSELFDAIESATTDVAPSF